MGLKAIGKKIQIAREEKGVTQLELAKILGITQAALSNYELGKRRLYLHQIEKIASYLEKPVSYFIDDGQYNSKTSDYEINYEILYDIYQKLFYLTKNEIDELNKYIDYLLWRRNNE